MVEINPTRDESDVIAVLLHKPASFLLQNVEVILLFLVRFV